MNVRNVCIYFILCRPIAKYFLRSSATEQSNKMERKKMKINGCYRHHRRHNNHSVPVHNSAHIHYYSLSPENLSLFILQLQTRHISTVNAQMYYAVCVYGSSRLPPS